MHMYRLPCPSALLRPSSGTPVTQPCPSGPIARQHPRSLRARNVVPLATVQSLQRSRASVTQPSIRLASCSNQSKGAQESGRRRPQTCCAPKAASVNPVTVRSADSAASSANHHPLTQQQLLDLGATFVRAWFAGIAKGPQAVEESLSSILHRDVVIVADKVRVFHDKTGLGEVLAELERAHLEYHRSEHRPMLYAASEQAQRVYALVEGRYQDVGALPGHPATFRISKVHHIVVLQVGAGGHVQKLWLRRQMTEEDKDELLHDPLACYPSPFPRDSLRLADAVTHEAASGQMVNAVKFWWQAWSAPRTTSTTTTGSSSSSSRSSSSDKAATSATAPPAAISGSSSSSAAGDHAMARTGRTLRKPDQAIAAGHILASDFKLWDAYGLWPSMRAQGRRHLNRDAAMHYLQQLRYAYDISLDVLDVAVAEGSLVCFSHWQAKLTPRWLAGPSDDKERPVSDTVTSAHSAAAAAAATGAAGKGQQQQPQPQKVPLAVGEVDDKGQQVFPSSSGSGSSSSADGSFVVDALEIDVFNEQLQLQDVWMFRGPIGPKEKQLFFEYDQEHAAAEAAAALAASAQDSIRAQRRAEREQQLTELLAWMNQYQQQWSDYVKHVQKALERQQQLAHQQIKQQAFVVDQLAQRYQELQQQHAQQQQQEQQEMMQQQSQADAAHAAPAASVAAADQLGQDGEQQQQQQQQQESTQDKQ